MIDLSVIIPMYNASKYIIEAVNSLLRQKDVSIEVIIVDDGSTDNSLEKLQQYGNRLVISKKENGGAASARNMGLLKAQGEFIMFLDADDYISDENICSKCIAKLRNDNLDIIFFSYKYLNNTTKQTTIPWKFPKKAILSSNYIEIQNLLIKKGIFLASPCFRILKRNFLIDNNIYFKEGRTAEDIDWYIKTITKTKHIGIIDNCAYVYRKSIVNAVTNCISIQKCEDLYSSILDSVLLVKSIKNEKFKNTLLSAIAYEYCILISNVYSINAYNLFSDRLKKMKYLLKYETFSRVRYIRILCSFVGLKITAKILSYYQKKYAKSNQ